jgi:DNA-binding response OmpR family regulator
MMTRSGPRRERAIIAVLRTGRIPRQNVTQLEFCDLVRTAARIRQTSQGFPRGWSKASIMNSASKITGGAAMLCERCKTEITLANLLDAEPDVNRRRRELAAGGERRVLPPTAWALFEALYAGRGEPVSGDFLAKVIGVSVSEHLHQLRRALAGSRYRVQTHRGMGYELTVGKRSRVRRGHPTRLGI